MSPELEATFRDTMCMKLRSFRKDGTPVDTPTWCIPIDGNLCCYTDDRTFKYKRMRREPRIEVSACDVWGRRSTEWYRARVHFVQEEPARQRVFQELRAKYKIHYDMSLWGSLLVGRVPHRVVLRVELDEPVQPIQD
jgi:PPOX class probable F420-dependent enzyme